MFSDFSFISLPYVLTPKIAHGHFKVVTCGICYTLRYQTALNQVWRGICESRSLLPEETSSDSPKARQEEPSKKLFNCPHEGLTRGATTALSSLSAHSALALEILIFPSCISLLVLLNTVEMSITAEQSL